MTGVCTPLTANTRQRAMGVAPKPTAATTAPVRNPKIPEYAIRSIGVILSGCSEECGYAGFYPMSANHRWRNQLDSRRPLVCQISASWRQVSRPIERHAYSPSHLWASERPFQRSPCDPGDAQVPFLLRIAHSGEVGIQLNRDHFPLEFIAKSNLFIVHK